MCLTPFRGSNRPTNTIVPCPSSSASGSASGVKTSVSIPFGIVVKRREGKYGCSDSTTASETLMEASRRRKTRRSRGREDEQRAIVLRDDAVERADGHGRARAHDRDDRQHRAERVVHVHDVETVARGRRDRVRTASWG